MANNRLQELQLLHDRTKIDLRGHYVEVMTVGETEIKLQLPIHPINGGLKVDSTQFPKLVLDATTEMKDMGFDFHPTMLVPYAAFNLGRANFITRKAAWDAFPVMQKIQAVLGSVDSEITKKSALAIDAIVKSVGITYPGLVDDLVWNRMGVVEDLALFLRHVLALALQEAKVRHLIAGICAPIRFDDLTDNRFIKALTRVAPDPIGVWKYHGVDIKVPTSIAPALPVATEWWLHWLAVANPMMKDDNGVILASFDYKQAMPLVQWAYDNVPFNGAPPNAVKLQSFYDCNVKFVSEDAPREADKTFLQLRKHILEKRLQKLKDNGIDMWSVNDEEDFLKWGEALATVEKSIAERAKTSSRKDKPHNTKQEDRWAWDAMYTQHNIEPLSSAADVTPFFLSFRSWIALNKAKPLWKTAIAAQTLHKLVIGDAQIALQAHHPDDEEFKTVEQFTKTFGTVFGGNNSLYEEMNRRWQSFQFKDSTMPHQLVNQMTRLLAHLRCALELAAMSLQRRDRINATLTPDCQLEWFSKQLAIYRDGIILRRNQIKWDANSIPVSDRRNSFTRYKLLFGEYQEALNSGSLQSEGQRTLERQIKSGKNLNSIGKRPYPNDQRPYNGGGQRRRLDRNSNNRDSSDRTIKLQPLSEAGARYRPPDDRLGRSTQCDTCEENRQAGRAELCRNGGHDTSQHVFLTYNFAALLNSRLTDQQYEVAKKDATEYYHNRYGWTQASRPQYRAEARKFVDDNPNKALNNAFFKKDFVKSDRNKNNDGKSKNQYRNRDKRLNLISKSKTKKTPIKQEKSKHITFAAQPGLHSSDEESIATFFGA